MLIEGIAHTFWVVHGKDSSDRLSARSRVRVKVRLASWFISTKLIFATYFVVDYVKRDLAEIKSKLLTMDDSGGFV